MDLTTLGLSFIAGALSTLSPCVLPILPIVIAGAAAQGRLAIVWLAGGLALSFTAIGLFVATVGFAAGLDADLFRAFGALAMLGIGIVALPAGILGSAFSDQLHQQREEMVREFDAAFSDGMLTEEELGRLEEERVRLHLSEEQFEAMKQRAFAKHADVDAGEFRVDDMVDRVNQMKRLLDGLPPGLAVEKIRALPLSEKDKAALLVLLG
jgi:hypothetical protein